MNQGKQVDHGLLDWNSIWQRDPFLEPLTMNMGELNHPGEGLHPANHRADCHKNHLAKVMPFVSPSAWIFDHHEVIKAFREAA